MKTYVDSSFLTAGYVRDAHAPRVIRLMSAGPNIVLTPFNRAELANAIFQQVYQKKMSYADGQAAFRNFESDCRQGVWTLVAIPASVWDRCVELAQRYGPVFGVRTLDSLHVACALELGATQFWTFDERQERLAIAAGLDTTV